MAGTSEVTAWQPQPGPQTHLLTCTAFEVLYGGARGGGKTDGCLGEWLQHASLYHEAANGLMVRRTRVELHDTIERSRVLYGPIGATYHEQQAVWRMPTGARLRFAYLERDADAMAYQGHNYTRVYPEEAGNFPSPDPIMKLMATLRSAAGVPCRMRLTANPGGPGHHWIKARYIDPAPGGYKLIVDPETGMERIYIPSRVTDNAELLRNDPKYVDRLRMSGSPELVKAWLEGDWGVIAGAFFSEFSMQRHVLRAKSLPNEVFSRRFAAVDWGSAKPFSVQWYGIADDDWRTENVYGEPLSVPRGSLVLYREWYGMQPGRYDVGLRLNVNSWAKGVLERSPKDERIEYVVCDTQMWAEDGGPSLAERAMKVRHQGRSLNLRKADKRREPGWDQVRQRLREDPDDPASASYFVMDNCPDTIRTFQSVQHDDLRPEDIDTDSEDHACDAARYACMSRPKAKSLPPKRKPPKGPKAWTMDWLDKMDSQEREQLARRRMSVH